MAVTQFRRTRSAAILNSQGVSLSKLQTVQKIGPLLDLFTVDRHTWGVSEVAEALDMPRSSAHALLTSTVDIGLLQMRGRGRYSIGWRVLELSEVLRSRTDIRSVAAPILEQFVRENRETTHLAVIDRMTVLYIDKVMGTHNLTVQGARVGARLEAHCTAVGKLLLAHQDPARVEEYYSNHPLPRFTPTTITSLPKLMEALVEVRRTGAAYDIGEQITELRCIAVPVRDEMGAVVAALSCTMPETRFTENRAQLLAALKQAAADIQSQIEKAMDDPASLRAHTPGLVESTAR